MAVSVDSVYQKVLAIANKEQRGYITPQEFNLFADQAQMEIFEQYFYDVNQFKRIPGEEEHYNTPDLINSKLWIFRTAQLAVTEGTSLDTLPNFYRLGDVFVRDQSFIPSATNIVYPMPGYAVIEQIESTDLYPAQFAPLTRATRSRPVFHVTNNRIYFWPKVAPPGYVFVARYTRYPVKPNWTYLIGNNQTALFNPDASAGWQDFELHPSEESKLVIKILQLAGINMKDYNLAQLAGQKEISVIQQEKQ